MRQRLRKKKRVGEFRELGFAVAFRLQPTLDEAGVDAFFDDFIDVVEKHNLGFGGGGKIEWQGYVTRMGRGSTSDVDRQALNAFFEQDPRVQVATFGPLTDAWYGDWDEDLPLPAL